MTNALDGLHCDHARDGTLRSRQMTRTPAQVAAFKAANLAAAPIRHDVQSTKAVKPSHRQEWQEFRQETLGMIEAAKRQGHFNLLPQLMQRLQNANTILSTIN